MTFMTTFMTSARKVLTIATMGLRRLLRDRAAAFIILFFPLLLVLVLGSVFGGGLEPGVGVVAPSDDALAREVVATLEDNDDIDVSHYDSRASLQDAVELGVVEAGVVIPEGYTDQLMAGVTGEVGFVTRPGGLGAQLRPVIDAAVEPQATRLQAARLGSEHGGTSFDAALQQATELGATLPRVTVRTTTVGEELFPSSLGQFDLSASSQLLLFIFVSGLASSAVLIQSRQLGVSRRMLSTPTSSRVVVVGEMCGRLAVTLFQGVYIMVTTWLLFGVDWGDPAGAVAVLLVFALVAAGAAMLIGAVFTNDQQAQAIGVILGLGLAALGGSMTPLELFSPLMRDIAHITPHAWANEAFAELVRRNGGLTDILPQLAVLVTTAAVLLGLATWRLRRTLTTP
jgi:ABC-2 type transport system permease protein